MAERLTWSPADGSPLVDLSDEEAGYDWEAEGTRGLRSVTYGFATGKKAGVDGEDVQAVRAEAGHPSVGLLVRASSDAELRERIRRLVHAMRPKAGPGVLTVSTEDGRSRRLRCYYEDGLPGDESEDTTMPGRWFKAVLRFYAPDPWWYGDPVTVTFGLAAPSVFLSPTLPMPRALSSSSIQGQVDIDLTAIDDTTPGLWTITGPGVGLTLRRQLLLPDGTVDPTPWATRTLQSSASIPDGGTVVIRTKRGEQSIRRGTGDNLGGSLAAGSSFWQLVDGRVNRVTVLLGGAGANSRLDMVYRPKFGGV